MEGVFHWWVSDRATKRIRELPCIITWGVWIVRNKAIFQGLTTTPETVASQSLGILSFFPQGRCGLRVRNLQFEEIDHTRPWGFFDGASQGEPYLCGGGGGHGWFTKPNRYTLLLSFRWPGGRCNNFAELMALKLLLLFALEKGCRSLQVFGDSMVIINWEKEIQSCHIMRLLPILEEILILNHLFDSLSFKHVYREHNETTDRLSKEGTQLSMGQWRIEEHGIEGPCSHYHRPFHEGPTTGA
jgi:ribonuclease HI